MRRFICLVLSNMLSPQSSSRVFPSTPQLLDAIVRLVASDRRTALIRFIGTPQNPKPPTRRNEPCVMPYMALRGLLNILVVEKSLLILENSINSI